MSGPDDGAARDDGARSGRSATRSAVLCQRLLVPLADETQILWGVVAGCGSRRVLTEHGLLDRDGPISELDPLPNHVNVDVSNAPSPQCASLHHHAASRGRGTALMILVRHDRQDQTTRCPAPGRARVIAEAQRPVARPGGTRSVTTTPRTVPTVPSIVTGTHRAHRPRRPRRDAAGQCAAGTAARASNDSVAPGLAVDARRRRRAYWARRDWLTGTKSRGRDVLGVSTAEATSKRARGRESAYSRPRGPLPFSIVWSSAGRWVGGGTRVSLCYSSVFISSIHELSTDYIIVPHACLVPRQ